MSGIKILPRKELSPYKPSDLWTQRENEVFLKYCPSKRDKAYHSMAIDTSCRPHELLGLKIKDIKFKLSSRGIQYAEVLVSGKTKTRTGYDIGLSPRVSMGFKSLSRCPTLEEKRSPVIYKNILTTKLLLTLHTNI